MCVKSTLRIKKKRKKRKESNNNKLISLEYLPTVVCILHVQTMRGNTYSIPPPERAYSTDKIHKSNRVFFLSLKSSKGYNMILYGDLRITCL